MHLARRLISGLRALIRRDRDELELDEELRTFLEADVERRVQSGVSRDAAERAARVAIGSIESVKDRTRDAGWELRIERVWQDARYALRGLRRSPGFAATAVLTLALGIGANTAIFSVVNGLLLRTLPVPSPEQLMLISTRGDVDAGYPSGWNYAVWDQIRQRREFGRAIAWTVMPQQFDLAPVGESEHADGVFVNDTFFSTLGVPALLGRTFTADEDILGNAASHVAVISHGFWQRRFGGAPDVIGRPLTVNRFPVTIIGVTPANFLGMEVGRAFDVALPIGSAPVVLNQPDWGGPAGRSYLAVMLRLQQRQSPESVATVLRNHQRSIIEAAMPRDAIWGPVQDALLKDPFTLVRAGAGTSELRRQYVRPLVTVLAIGALVLLIACANIASLLLARATARQHELRVRLALGASRWRLVRQMLVESLLLSILGATTGLLVATTGAHALVAQLSTWFDRVVLDVSLDWRVLAFTAGVAIVTAVLFGIAPALTASATAPGFARRGESADLRGFGVGHISRVRGSLVASQIALSLVLLIAAGLFIRTFERLGAVHLGFDSQRVLVVTVNASRSSVDLKNRSAFYHRLADAVRTVPGVAKAAVSLNTPVNHGVTAVSDFTAPGGRELPPRERRAIVNLVTPGWFETYDMRLMTGRFFQPTDTATAPSIAVVNEAFAKKFFGNRSPLGAYITAQGPPDPVPMLVVGVVGDAVDQSLRYGSFPTVYQPLAQFKVPMPIPNISLSVQAESGAPAASLAQGVSAVLTSADRGLAFSVHALGEQLAAARQQERLIAWLGAFFGGLALALAGIGLYGVTSYAVARRRTEFGIRITLGATRRDVLGLSLRKTIVMMASGIAIGLALAAGVTRYLDALLFGITPLDPLTFLAAPAVLVLVALVASYLPARRATKLDPMTTLRCE